MWYKHQFNRTISVLLFFVICICLQAQDISVSDFYCDEKDLTANKAATIVEDQNGDKCALIRVQTVQKGFHFDVGSLGVQKVEDQHPGEIWVYVPQGVRHIKILHDKLGTLPNYDFPMAIKGARTYVMIITTNQVFVNNYDDKHRQKLRIIIPQARSEVSKSLLSINGMNVNLKQTKEGAVAEQELAFGTYTYKVDIPCYYPEEGQVLINDSLKAQTLLIDSLRPITGKLKLIVSPLNATISIDGKHIDSGIALQPQPLQIGKHTVIVSADKYHTEKIVADITKDSTTEVRITLKQEAEFSITSSPGGSDISITPGAFTAITPCKGKFTSGSYNVLVSKKGYKDIKRTITLNCADPKLHFRLSKIYNYKKEFYFGTDFSVGQYFGAGGVMGFYVSNVNVEANAHYPVAKSENIYWTDGESKPMLAVYSPQFEVGVKVGYGISLGTRFRLTPQLGVNIMKMHNTADMTSASGLLVGTSVTSLTIGTRFSCAIANHFGVSISPLYAVGMIKPDGYKKLSEVSSKIKGWGTGFNANIGLYMFF